MDVEDDYFSTSKLGLGVCKSVLTRSGRGRTIPGTIQCPITIEPDYLSTGGCRTSDNGINTVRVSGSTWGRLLYVSGAGYIVISRSINVRGRRKWGREHQ